MIELIGGDLYQWDTGRIVTANPESDTEIHEVHFTTKYMDYAYVVNTYKKDGLILCAVPNIILQQERSVICYEVAKTDNGEMTVSETIFTLHRRNKPDDYAYTESEILNYETLAKTALTEQELSDLINELNGGE